MSNSRIENWTTIISSVQTPLGFFTLLALILDGFLLGISALTATVSIWAPILLLGLLILCVFLIVMINPKALYHPRDLPPERPERPMKIKVRFPADINPVERDFEFDLCSIEIRDLQGIKRSNRTLDLKFGQNIWYIEVRIEPSDSVRLELVEKSGQRWKILPFDPNESLVVDALPKN